MNLKEFSEKLEKMCNSNLSCDKCEMYTDDTGCRISLYGIDVIDLIECLQDEKIIKIIKKN